MEQLTSYFSESLKGMLNESRNAISRQQYMNPVLFIVVLVISGVLVSQNAANAKTLNESSKELNTLSDLMSGSSNDISQRSDTANQASSDLKTNMNSISTSMEEASSNTGTVAAATEEMTSTIHEIASNSEKARKITDQALFQVDQATRRVKELGTAADDIGKVTEAIHDISDKTNLLALNATIENDTFYVTALRWITPIEGLTVTTDGLTTKGAVINAVS